MITVLFLRVAGAIFLLLGAACFFTPRAFFSTLYDYKSPNVMEINTLAFLGVNLVTIALFLFWASPASLSPLLFMLVFTSGCVANELLHPLSSPDMLNIIVTSVLGIWCIFAIFARPSSAPVKRS